MAERMFHVQAFAGVQSQLLLVQADVAPHYTLQSMAGANSLLYAQAMAGVV